jgi:hypothetical protein
MIQQIEICFKSFPEFKALIHSFSLLTNETVLTLSRLFLQKTAAHRHFLALSKHAQYPVRLDLHAQ